MPSASAEKNGSTASEKGENTTDGLKSAQKKNKKKVKTNERAGSGQRSLAAANESTSNQEELKQKISRLEFELAKECAYRNHAQLERDKINAFWEISKRRIKDAESRARESERLREASEDDCDVRIRAKMQQIKHEQCENERRIEAAKAKSAEMVRTANEEFENRVEEMKAKAREDERKITEREVKCQESLRKSEIERMKEIGKLRIEFEEKREAEREVAARRERAHFEKAERTLAETVESLQKNKELQLKIMETESAEHLEKIEKYYRALKESAEEKTIELSAKVAELERRVYHAETEAKRAQAKADALEQPAKIAEQKAETEEKKRLRAERKVQRLEFLERAMKQSEQKLEMAEKSKEIAIQSCERALMENASLRETLSNITSRTTTSHSHNRNTHTNKNKIGAC